MKTSFPRFERPMGVFAHLALLVVLSCSPGASPPTAGPSESGGSAGSDDPGGGAGPASGGTVSSGASPGAGGETGSGGSGGTFGSGGHASGGTLITGGAPASGGHPSAGGQVGVGGDRGVGGDVGSGGGGVFPHDGPKPRIMIIGDSISAGPGCYKKYLLKELETSGYSHFEFVGEYTDDCGGDVRHSAVSCSTSLNFTQRTFELPSCFAGETFPGMTTLMANHDPDLVMIQLGVNDVWGGTAPIDSILDNYTLLVEQGRAHNPQVVFVVAQIHRIITENCTNFASLDNAEDLVRAVPSWAAGMSSTDSPVFVADLWTNSDPTDADDCVHPNDAGAQRMALNWFNALKPILSLE